MDHIKILLFTLYILITNIILFYLSMHIAYLLGISYVHSIFIGIACVLFIWFPITNYIIDKKINRRD